MLFEENKITHFFRKKAIVSIYMVYFFGVNMRKYLSKIAGKYEEMTLIFGKKNKEYILYLRDRLSRT